MTYEYQQYLAHYGVKGQKHGRRRYQNEDGSLTPEGKEHYGIGDSKYAKYFDEKGYLNDQGKRRYGRNTIRFEHLQKRAAEMNKNDVTPEKRRQHEQDQLREVAKAERERRRGQRIGITMLTVAALGAADLATHGKSTKMLKNAASKAIKSITQSKTQAKAAQWLKRRRSGGYQLRKKDFWVGPIGLPSGR